MAQRDREEKHFTLMMIFFVVLYVSESSSSHKVDVNVITAQTYLKAKRKNSNFIIN